MGALRDFVADVLESEGAAIEPVEPDGLEVLAPEPLRLTMGWPELARLGFGPELPPGAMAVGFEGDWLTKFGALLGPRGCWAERQATLPGLNLRLGSVLGRVGTQLFQCDPRQRVVDQQLSWVQ